MRVLTITILGLSFAILLLVTVGCAPAASTPTPTVVRPAASPTAVPTLTATPLPTATPTPKPKTKVIARMDFVLSGQHSPFYLATEKGWYAENGLEVEIQEGNGCAPALQLVANKTITFTFCTGPSVATAVKQGMPVKMVAKIFGELGLGLLALPNTKLDNAKDLEGKTLGLSPGSTALMLWPGFVEYTKIDASKVSIVNTTIQAKRQLLFTNKVDVIEAGQADYVNTKAEFKAEPKALWYKDNGLAMVGFGIITHNDMTKDKPDIVKAFIAATLKAYDYARQNPDEAIAAMVKAKPDVNRPTLKDEFLTWVKNTWDTPDTKGKPLGWMSEKEWQSTQDIAEKYLEQPKMPVSNYYTNEFIPK